MAAGRQSLGVAAQPGSFLEALDAVSEAVESGAGLPSVTRAAGRALDASVIVLDASSSVLAVACSSPEDERAVMAREAGTETVELLVAEVAVGQLRFRPRSEPPPAALLRLVGQPDRPRARARQGARACQRGGRRRLPGRPARAPHHRSREHRARARPSSAATCLTAPPPWSSRARPQHPEEGDWRARVLTLAERGARALERGSLAALVDGGLGRHARLRARARDPQSRARAGRRVAAAVHRELEASLAGFLSPSRARATRAIRPTSTAPAPRRCSPPTSPRRVASASSPSRRPAPTGCCCRR